MTAPLPPPPVLLPPALYAALASATPLEAAALTAALPKVAEALLAALRSEQGYATVAIPVESGTIKRPLVQLTLRF